MSTEDAIMKTLDDPLESVYYFSRALISSDRAAGIGSNSKKMLELSSAIQKTLKARQDIREDELVPILLDQVYELLLRNIKKGSKRAKTVEGAWDYIKAKLETVSDFKTLALACERILVPINNSLQNVPSDDRIFVESMAKALLAEKGEKGLATIINLWDDLGTEGCLAAERVEVVREFGLLSSYLDEILPSAARTGKNIVLTAFCQEFERRLGQKRKARAGGSLESVTSYILKFFGIKTTGRPEHFTAGLEVDKWIRCTDGWILGIGCKRTLRERWKQAYTTNVDELNRHKIKGIWHVITYDKDLSDQKITEMGSHRALLFLPDGSPRLVSALAHEGMKNYVRPITTFIQELKTVIG